MNSKDVKRWVRQNPKMAAGGALSGMLLGMYLLLRTKTKFVFRDLGFLIRAGGVARRLKNTAGKEWTLADMFEDSLAKYPKKEAVVYIEEKKGRRASLGRKLSYTYAEVDAKANQVGHWALASGIKAGDTVALMMDNRPEFIWTWLGLLKIGVTTALINTNLRGRPLDHSFSTSLANTFIIGEEHVGSVSPDLLRSGRWFFIGGGEISPATIPSTVKALDDALALQPSTPIPRECRSGVLSDQPACYIYTSGTTGNPKAAKVTHLRVLGVSSMFISSLGIQPSDRIYTTLPLYHSAAGMIGVGSCWNVGMTMVLRRKFSARRFWTDAKNYNCTVTQYIGELCRYLLMAPPGADDRAHKLRVAIGNGLRPDIWEEFQGRFGIPLIGEFYGSTEGNVGFVNAFGKTGAVGYASELLQLVFPAKLVKFDMDSEEPLRDPKTGLCIPCKAGEVGELLGVIDQSDPLRQFKGYTDEKATAKKILRDVLKKGDMYFRSGDLMKYDDEGFWYFVDRIGDTFRWKGENVATTEVAEVISQFPGVVEVNVYGVKVPGRDGRAGMACIVADPSFDFKEFFAFTKKELPSYAIPLFLRIQREIQVTSTFKHQKRQLVVQGFDPSKVEDQLYFRMDAERTYVPLDEKLYSRIVTNPAQAKL